MKNQRITTAAAQAALAITAFMTTVREEFPLGTRLVVAIGPHDVQHACTVVDHRFDLKEPLVIRTDRGGFDWFTSLERIVSRGSNEE